MWKDVKSEEKNWTVRRIVNQEHKIEEHKKEKKEKVIKWNHYSMRMKTSRKLWEKPSRGGIFKRAINIVKLVKNCSVFGFENMCCATWVPLQEGLPVPAAKSAVSPSGTILSAERPSPKVIPLSGLNPSNDRWMQVYTSLGISAWTGTLWKATLVPELPAAVVEPAP